jgi:hypothetical protein
MAKPAERIAAAGSATDSTKTPREDEWLAMIVGPPDLKLIENFAPSVVRLPCAFGRLLLASVAKPSATTNPHSFRDNRHCRQHW